ncbi:MAG: hypothetical protein H0Z33_02110 [Bacillaceae bacterium]|nr:hypothetical protein [Bacillaceae bacterium]
MFGKIRHLYAGAHTSVGFYGLYKSAFNGLDRLFILKGGPGTGQSRLIQDIATDMNEQGMDIELYHNPSDQNALDGVIIYPLRVGIVDGTAPQNIDPELPGVKDEIVNLGDCWNRKELISYRELIFHLYHKIESNFQSAYQFMSEAKHIHDEWEDVYLKEMDFHQADQLAGELEEKMLGDRIGHGAGQIRRRFFGALTPAGFNHYIDNLTSQCSRRFIIKGRPGTGKSTMMKKIVSEAEKRNFDLEVYHCGFDPQSLDMVVVPELKVAVLDGTAPHVIDPVRQGDQVVDTYRRCIRDGLDEEKSDVLRDIVARYKDKMKNAEDSLKEAKKLYDELAKYYTDAMDFEQVELKKAYILSEIKEMLE